MMKHKCRSRWTVCLVALALAGVQPVYAASQSRNLNPYHEQQLESQIRKCASGVMACTDAEEKSVRQQELCQLLIRAERYDEALQVSYNIYRAESSSSERKAAYHFMVAEIYSRKMKAATTTAEMDSCRRSALAAAQEVLDQKYPAKWGVSGYARELVRNLNDSESMGRLRQRVANRQGQGDSTKEAIADAQRRYLDATQGHGSAGYSGSNQPQFVRVAPASTNPSTNGEMAISSVAGVSSSDNDATEVKRSPTETARRAADQQAMALARGAQGGGSGISAQRLPSEPSVTRVVSPMQRLTAGEQEAMSRLGATGLLTSQPGMADAIATTNENSYRSPILVNGQPANSVTGDRTIGPNEAKVESIVQSNLETLLESARKRKAAERGKSPYATGQMPQTNMR